MNNNIINNNTKPQRECIICNSLHRRPSPTCQRCYQYQRRHPEGRYPLPSPQTIAKAPNGDLICHICGEAHPKLMQHVYYTHHKSKREYCQHFGFLYNQQFTHDDYHNKMSDYTRQYEHTVIQENLIKNGQSTRFQPNQFVPLRGHHIKINNNIPRKEEDK